MPEDVVKETTKKYREVFEKYVCPLYFQSKRILTDKKPKAHGAVD